MKEYTLNGKTYKQIRKDTARKLYTQGQEIALLQCKTNPFSFWNNFYTMTPGEQFESIVNAYEYYNCNGELGQYANFYTVVIR